MNFQPLSKTQPSRLRALLRRGLATALAFTFVVASMKAAPPDGVEQIAGGVIVHVPGGDMVKVVFTTERIVQVSAWPEHGQEPAASYVVTRTGTLPGVTVDTARDGAVTVGSPVVRASVDLHTGAVSFADAQGAPLLSEVDRKFTAVPKRPADGFEVEQVFACRPDESLFGLGQTQDGVWNLRGMPVDLRQHNTNIAVPVLVSTAGYGILWDNAARTQFNPVDTPVALTVATAADTGGPSATENLGAKKKGPPPLSIRNGTFTTGEAGEYVFFMQNGDRRDEIGILVDGQPIFELKNLWTPYSAVGTVRLPAHTTVPVTLRGGGADAVLSARLRETGRTVFRSAAGEAVRYDFFYGPGLGTVVADYRQATGDAPLLPRWAYGFWQCRERYSSQDEVLAAAAKYRDLHLPLDAIVQDWQYWGKYGWGAYQWDETHYPDPAAMIRQLHGENVHFMISVWPNPSGVAGEALKTIPHGKIGNSSYYDPSNPEARKMRWDFINKAFYSIGTDAWWQDAAEPGDDGNSCYGASMFVGPGDQNALAYPLWHSETIYEGQRATDPEKRVCNLTRSAYSGEQRYGTIIWSGDINGDWITFRRQIPAGLNFSLSGLPYWTTDSGGFFRPGNRYKDEEHNELQARWFEWSTFCPIQRIHAYQTTTEFWNWLPATQEVLAAYDRLRYRLLPYNYSVAWQVTHEQGTFMRALAMDFPQDPQAVAASNEYLFGPAFLVCPVTASKPVNWRVYLPRGASWINFWTGESSAGGSEVEVPAPLGQIPLFVRAGSIVPFGPALEYTSEKPADPIELRVYRGADGDFTLYEDEGDSYRYESGARATVACHWDDTAGTLTLGKREGDFPGMLRTRTFRVVLVGGKAGIGTSFDAPGVQTVTYDGTAQTLELLK